MPFMVICADENENKKQNAKKSLRRPRCLNLFLKDFAGPQYCDRPRDLSRGYSIYDVAKSKKLQKEKNVTVSEFIDHQSIRHLIMRSFRAHIVYFES